VTSGPVMAAKTSVVIASHTLQRRAALTEAVASALAQGPYEVVVAVDNNADLYDWVRARWTDVVAVHHQGTPGASATRNAGARVAAGRLLAFLDDDAVARPGWLPSLTAPLVRQEVAGVGGLVEPVWLGRVPEWMPDEFLWVVGASYRGLPSTAAPVRNVWSMNMAVAQEDFWAVGGFREGFGKTGHRSQPEDTDFCIRLTSALKGRTCWYEPSARVGHNIPPDRGTLRFFVHRCFNEGQGKADITALLGSDEGLADERRHAAKTLPEGIRRELRQAVTAREFSAAQRALAMCIGLGAAGLGYLVRKGRSRLAG
jgi:GT2 family glycosyltransferase